MPIYVMIFSKKTYIETKREENFMEIIKTGAMVVIFISAIIIFLIALFSKKIIKTLFLNALTGIVVLIVINLISKYINVYLPINEWTVSFSGVYGLPAVIGMIVLNTVL